MNDVHYKLKTLVNELKDLGIESFLISNEYTRICNEGGFGEVWNKTQYNIEFPLKFSGRYINKYDVCYEAFCQILNKFYLALIIDSFETYLSITLIGFLSYRNLGNRFEKVIQDLDFLKISIENKETIYQSYYQNVLRTVENERQRKKEEAKRQEEIERKRLLRNEKKNSSLNVKAPQIEISSFDNKKKNWKLLISKAEIQKVADEIIEYGVENEDDIIALSSRWNSLQIKYHKGVMKDDDFSIENNKIVQALIDLIKKLKNTEG